MKNKIQIGVSSCLLGNEVRHDGSHKKDRYITGALAEYFSYVAFCPETAIGLGVPRPAIRLVESDSGIRLVDSKNGHIDHTRSMQQAARSYCSSLAGISGYILKNRSPSCGMQRVNVYQPSGMAVKNGVGVFAQQLMALNPNLPVEEEGRLNDPAVRENFIERVFAYNRWRSMTADKITLGGLMEFHQSHKFILLAHSNTAYRRLGRMVSKADKNDIDNISAAYIAEFMRAMKIQPSRKTHVNVLQHSMGYLKKIIDQEDKSVLLDTFRKYASGQVPLVVPMTLLKYHFRKNPQGYIDTQHYMDPYPEELMLRNHV